MSAPIYINPADAACSSDRLGSRTTARKTVTLPREKPVRTQRSIESASMTVKISSISASGVIFLTGTNVAPVADHVLAFTSPMQPSIAFQNGNISELGAKARAGSF